MPWSRCLQAELLCFLLNPSFVAYACWTCRCVFSAFSLCFFLYECLLPRLVLSWTITIPKKEEETRYKYDLQASQLTSCFDIIYLFQPSTSSHTGSSQLPINSSCHTAPFNHPLDHHQAVHQSSRRYISDWSTVAQFGLLGGKGMSSSGSNFKCWEH